MNNIMKKTLIIIVALLLFIFFSGCRVEVSDPMQEEVLLVQYYYFNICSSCDPEAKFLEKFEELTGLSIRTQNLEIEMYNVYDEGSKSIWDDVASEFGIPKDIQEFPIIRIADDFKFLSEIDEALSEDKFKTVLPENDFTVLKNASVILYFSSPGCHDCSEAEEMTLSKLPKEIVINDISSPIQVFKISTADKKGIDMLKTYFREYYVPEEKQKTPIVFVGYTYLLGSDEISNLSAKLGLGEGLETPILNIIDEQEESILSGYGWLGVFAIGLLNGLNPCAISMILMLLSLITVNRNLILPVGLAFGVGKFIGFLLLGTLLYSIIDKLPLDSIAVVSKIILLILSGAMVILNLNDLIASKNEKYQKIRLQLPKGLRKKNHDWLKKIVSVKRPAMIITVGLLLGLVLSAGEFLCTGQIYLATIVQVVHSGAKLSGTAFWYLMIYCIAFVIPMLVMVIIVSAGRKVFVISDKFRRNMPFVKLSNMLIFILFFILVWFLY